MFNMFPPVAHAHCVFILFHQIRAVVWRIQPISNPFNKQKPIQHVLQSRTTVRMPELTCMRAEMCLQRFFPREDTIAVVAFNRGRRNRTLDHERRQCFGARPAALAFRLFGRPAATAGRVPGVRCALATVAPVPMPVR